MKQSALLLIWSLETIKIYYIISVNEIIEGFWVSSTYSSREWQIKLLIAIKGLNISLKFSSTASVRREHHVPSIISRIGHVQPWLFVRPVSSATGAPSSRSMWTRASMWRWRCTTAAPRQGRVHSWTRTTWSSRPTALWLLSSRTYSNRCRAPNGCVSFWMKVTRLKITGDRVVFIFWATYYTSLLISFSFTNILLLRYCFYRIISLFLGTLIM